MDRTERFYKIDQLLQERRAVPLTVLMETLGVSRATVKRDLEYLRDRLNAPIVWDRDLRGYRFEMSDADDSSYALPGLWFNASEAYALLMMEQLLSDLQPGLLGPHIEPLRTRIKLLLERGDHSVDEISHRIHILHLAARPVVSEYFATIANALLERKRLQIDHYNRGTDQTVTREISPQRLVYYRDNWYLDAWCHLRKGLRSFGVDVIRDASPLDKKAREIPKKTLDTILGSGYGIFSGQQTRNVVLRFTPERARWVSKEQWHPEQESHFDEEGHYVLTLPYSDDTELLMDILRYGPDVEVLSPASLRKKIIKQSKKICQIYEN